jgi:outer membrane protein assembly factor BamD
VFISKILNLFFAISLITLSSCNNIEKKKTAKSEYEKGLKFIKNSNFLECSNKFDSIIDEFPFTIWSKESKILSAYCHYKENSYPKTIAITEDFINNYPSDKNITYMQYLRAISYYQQMPNISRSQSDSKIALYTFKDLIARNYDSKHAKDSQKKIKIINENIAGYYMEIGRFYEKKSEYIAAIKNFNYIINNYSFTKQYPEALYRIYAIYYHLGIISESNKARNILLKLDLPKNNKWIKYLNERI